MPRRRDPFPMASDQAKAMEASVDDGPATRSAGWNSMTTSANQNKRGGSLNDHGGDSNTNDDNDVEALESSSGLVRASNPTKTKDGDDDIYADLDGGGRSDHSNPHADDDFLDRPLSDSRARGLAKVGLIVRRGLLRTVERLYGPLPMEELVRTLVLASTLFFMIGGYWLLRSLKDPVLTALCGVAVIPKAKMASVFVVLFVVAVYNRLLDMESLHKHQLFYIFGSFYCGVFFLISLLLMHPTIGLPNEKPSPYRVLGWISYCAIESFGSVMVSLFWSFANSNITLTTAKASYGIMVATAQIGSILGPTFVNIASPRYGLAKCYLVGALAMLLLQGTMYTYVSIYGVQETKAAEAAAQSGAMAKSKKKPPAGILEGLYLFLEHHYVKGIFAISCLFMVEVTIVDFTMKVLAQQYFAAEHPCLVGASCYDAVSPGVHGSSQEATAAFAAFMGFFGQATNLLSFALSLLGTSAVIRTLGLRLSLLLFPSLCLLVIVIVRLNPTLYTVFGAMMALKACSYAFNNPTKEILYQPTSKAVRYKAKSWIDIFGARGSKALGSLVTNAFSDSATNLVANGSLVGMAVASFLIWNANFMGRKFDQYTATGYVVGKGDDDDDDEDGGDGAHLELAVAQADEDKDTSCGIYDDDQVGPEEEGQTESGSLDDEDDIGDFAKKPKVERV